MPPPPPLMQRPFLLMAVGLGLMLLGWRLADYAPPPTGELAAIRGMAADQPDLASRIDAISRTRVQQAPFVAAGRLAFFGGLGVFGFALVRMAKAPPPPEVDESPEG